MGTTLRNVPAVTFAVQLAVSVKLILLAIALTVPKTTFALDSNTRPVTISVVNTVLEPVTVALAVLAVIVPVVVENFSTI